MDVERYSLRVLNENMQKEIFNGIKDFVYNAPSTMKIQDETGEEVDVNVKIETILMIMSIYLRDKYFERHKEIDTTGFNHNP